MAERQGKNINLRDIQKVQLITLKAVRDFCDKNNIRYFLYCGSLLGCIRHGGFIPWDDDVDLTMPLEDYKKFSRLVREDEQFARKYTVIGSYHDKKSCFLWTKVIRKNTIYYDKRFLEDRETKGISLDIYPLIGEYENKLAKNIQHKALFLQKALFLTEQHKDTDYTYVKKPQQVPLFKIIALVPFRLRMFVSDRIRHWFWPDHNKHANSGTIDAAAFYGKYTGDLWQKSVEGVFEKERFIIPAEYDKILKIMYGDYMKLPPKGERTTSHALREICLYIGKDAAEEAGIDL